jgi:hypothetical protein
MSHTPGPWHVTGSDVGGAMVVTDQAEIAGWPDMPQDRSMANARLIAAAPQLLHALKAVVKAYGPDMQAAWVGMGRSGECHELVAARAAIAKAEGK